MMSASSFSFAQQNTENEPQAKERWFQIEIIIFKRNGKQGFKAEEWPDDVVTPDTSHALDFLSQVPSFMAQADETLNNIKPNEAKNGNTVEGTPITPKPPQTLVSIQEPEVEQTNTPLKITEPQKTITQGFGAFLDQEELPFYNIANKDYLLSPHARVISQSRKYKLIRYMSWHQPVFSKSKMTSVRIFGGYDYINDYNQKGLSRLEPAQTQTLMNPLSANVEDSGERVQNNNPNIESPSPLDTNQNSKILASEVSTEAENENNLIPDNPPYDFTNFNALKPHLWEIDGVFNIYVQRYLHVEFNLTLKHPATKEVPAVQMNQMKSLNFQDNHKDNFANDNPESEQESELPAHLTFETDFDENLLSINSQQNESLLKINFLKAYSMHQKRRIRSKKIHYFDHPLMGVILLVTPYDPNPKPIEEDDEMTQQGN